MRVIYELCAMKKFRSKNNKIFLNKMPKVNMRLYLFKHLSLNCVKTKYFCDN